MNDIELVNHLNDRLYDIYVEKGLTSLRGFDHDDANWFIFQGVDLHRKYMDSVEATIKFDRFAIWDDLVDLSDQIMYFTSELYLVTPFINNPLRHVVQPEGYTRPIYCNYENLSAKRYNSFSDIVAEKFYAYWNRLATLLNHYLPKPLNPKQVNFSVVIDEITLQLPEFHHNSGYIWLQAFKENEQKHLNKQRSTIVHHETTSTTFREQHRLNVHDAAALTLIMEERYSRPDFYKEHIEFSLTALKSALDLIAEIDPAVPEPMAPATEEAA
jgi:hypothetical protein